MPFPKKQHLSPLKSLLICSPYFAETYKNIYRYLYHGNRPRSGRQLFNIMPNLFFQSAFLFCLRMAPCIFKRWSALVQVFGSVNECEVNNALGKFKTIFWSQILNALLLLFCWQKDQFLLIYASGEVLANIVE